MRINFDGVTPVPRMLLLSEFQLNPDFHVSLDRPVFVTAGDRVSYEGGAVVVTRPTGEHRKHPAGNSYWICRR
ncbi:MULTISPECIES: hypothetical protein [unclassified Kitasatospora]|uniref:hypothetical protein n=1 Tax=unclassified Kitasatospora TaxID=2633591 RepID=UPI00070D7FD7|nr:MULTISPECIES: hypothetical protein [unclassified Kitasatospora]KQV19086.1 hypothetical protein ASC99_23160 [Kitasatospora sp. Root107]KRB63347.1 hypothetical protein ASE03_33345 [Kitasatospora sp. Root187]